MSRDAATTIVKKLRDAGHQAFFAGGCVRDHLLGIEPADYDVATSALPGQVEDLFDHTIAVGRSFGVIIVVTDGNETEVATFRDDGAYLDGRRPASVSFCDARNDSLRRDFTINAMFEDPLSGEILDFVGGRDDLTAGIIRTVGDPLRRFGEDHLRLLRAVRFAARFAFTIEASTLVAIAAFAPRLSQVSAERIGHELRRILTEGGARRGFELLDETGLLEVVLPEMTAMKGCAQSSDYHPEGDVFVHTLLCLEHLPTGCSLTLALGVLLHDIAKPPTAKLREGKHTFYGHCELGQEMAEEICNRWRYSNEVRERVGALVAQHLRHCAAAAMKPSTLKRFLRQDCIDELLELARIDALSSSGDLSNYEFCTNKLAEVSVEEMRPQPLINGRDLIAMGLEPGPIFGIILSAVEDAQLEGSITTREQALALARDEAERSGD